MSRSGKIVMSAFFASSFVRKKHFLNIFKPANGFSVVLIIYHPGCTSIFNHPVFVVTVVAFCHSRKTSLQSLNIMQGLSGFEADTAHTALRLILFKVARIPAVLAHK